MNYRSEARACLARAEAELKANDDQRLKYAALELRMAMEALTYDRAVAYKDEFPQSEYETWQPKKMMLVLLEIDPLADKDSTISFGKEKEYGKPAENMQLLGSERVLSMATLKKHYDALGSYLHLPTVKRFKSGELHDLRKLRSRCEEIANFIGEVLSSRVFNSTLGVFSTLDCDECGNKIRRRLRGGNNGQILAKCNECPASYIITEKGDDGVVWRPCQHEVQCANNSCQQSIIVWQREVEVGRCWTCQECKGRNVFVVAVRFDSSDAVTQTDGLIASENGKR